MTRPPRRFWILILLPLALVVVGTLGYHIIEEEYDLFDGFYMTILTLTTIGYGEIPHELSRPGRVFTVCLILCGVFAFAYSASEIVRSVVSGELAGYLGKQKMEHELAKLTNHIIVCGYGRMGHLACKEFSREGRPFVIIDSSADELKEFQLPHGIKLVGDATDDETLKHAGVQRAQYLVTVMSSDADNLFTTMSAKLLNEKLIIVARLDDMRSEQKLKKAGADRVVSPYDIGGAHVAQAVLKPTVVEFIELTTRTEHVELQLEETKVEPNSVLAGCKLRDTRLHADHQIIVVAIKKKEHVLDIPQADTIIEAGDILVAIGRRGHLDALERLAQAK
jgi:voltage-gated potassium channel